MGENIFPKERKNFGKQCLFVDKRFLMVAIPPKPYEFKDYIQRNPVDVGTQLSKQYAFSEANTMSATFDKKGMFHTEGGWPKDVDISDIEQKIRYRRKLEKDDAYIKQLPQMLEAAEFCILQNNAVNIYEHYFENLKLKEAPIAETCQSRTSNVYKDIDKPLRQVNHLSWSPDGGVKIAVTYCNKNFLKSHLGCSCNSYIWDVENPNQPSYTLSPKSPSICVEYHYKDYNFLVSGHDNGQCCVWDVRVGKYPVGITPIEVCHSGRVNSALWVNSKHGTEFFSGAVDGQVVWWDMRNLSEQIDSLYMDPMRTEEQNRSQSQSISLLEYETTIPSRFMVGSEHGMLFLCNRRGKSPMEKIVSLMQIHTGPVAALKRNPGFTKNFLSVGDWNGKVWSEDCKEGSLIWTKNRPVQLTDGCWSPIKPSLFCLSRIDGNVEVWDLLQQQDEPVLIIQVSDFSVNCVNPHESGKMIACGNADGTMSLVELSKSLTVSDKKDKVLLNDMFVRENKREKLLAGKLREIQIKRKKQQEIESAKLKPSLNQEEVDAAENDFFKMTASEQKRRYEEEVLLGKSKSEKTVRISRTLPNVDERLSAATPRSRESNIDENTKENAHN
ncbi:CLUMA_CG003276, isoform A [Clunio marinus]|uniref:CLUMA_CG003276, isoform A n=1 Tax=Clunio marinus TaxID=568069 RepID=A0A1J1HNF3_9DIPT|nr:CLUMA_CG003276, isoform A [Clunio marinus]